MNKTIRFKFIRNFLFTTGMLVILGLISACVTNVQVTGDGRVIGEYRVGYLIVKPNQSFERVHAATKSAFKDLGFLEVGDEQAPGEAVLKARDASDTLIEVKLKDFTSYTNVKIRCGVSGDLARSQQVYQAIARHF